MKTKPRRLSLAGTKKRERIFRFIANHPTGVLTTVDPNGNPHGSVIYYAADEDRNILFVTKERTRKHDNITHHNHVMLVVYDSEAQAVLQITGLAEQVEGLYDKQMDFAAVLTSSMIASGYPFSPVSKLSAGPYVVYKVKPVQIRLTTYGYPGQGSETLEGSEL